MNKYQLPPELTPFVNYTATANQWVFSYKFFVVDSGDMFVYINGIEISKNAYTVSGMGNDEGGFVSIKPESGLMAGDTVTLSRFTLPVQLTKFLRLGDFTAEAVNAEFNRLYALMQEQRRDFSQLVDVAETQGKQVEKNKINISKLDAKSSDLQQQINKEVADRQSADANLQKQVSGGASLEASAFSPISWHKQVIENSVTIPPDVNAWSFGPSMEIAEGQAVTISEGSFWTIASGKVEDQ